MTRNALWFYIDWVSLIVNVTYEVKKVLLRKLTQVSFCENLQPVTAGEPITTGCSQASASCRVLAGN